MSVEDEKSQNPFIGEDYCVISVNTLNGLPLLRAIKLAINSNDALNGKASHVFKISRVGGIFLLTELTPEAYRIAELEIRELQAAKNRYDSI